MRHVNVNLPFGCSGFGCDTTTVINILVHRDLTQRSLIQHEYRTKYSKELSSRVSSELKGSVKVQNDFHYILHSPPKCFVVKCGQ